MCLIFVQMFALTGQIKQMQFTDFFPTLRSMILLIFGISESEFFC